MKVKADKLSVKGLLGFSLDEPAQGRIAVRIGLGVTQYCTDAPAKTRGNPPSTAKFDNAQRFVGAPKTPAPATCVPMP